MLAFSSLCLLAFVSVCLRLFAFARICLRPPLLQPPLRGTDLGVCPFSGRIPSKFRANSEFRGHSGQIRGPPTTHHQVLVWGRGWCANRRNLRKRQIRTTTNLALAMLIVDSVGVVCGFHGLKTDSIMTQKWGLESIWSQFWITLVSVCQSHF